jgi:hypothetical protein
MSGLSLPGRARRRPLALLCLGLLLACAQLAQAAEPVPREPWNLGIVVDCSPEMIRPWLGTTRLLAAEAALQLELRTLPMRTRVGVWLVGGGPGQVREFIVPAPAAEAKGLQVILPNLAGGADLAAGVASAAAWAAGEGRGEGKSQGAVLVLAGPSGLKPGLAASLAVGGAGPFAHALIIGPEPGGQGEAGLEELALKGGGALFVAGQASQVSPLMHRAALLAHATSRLLVLAHDAANQPLPAVFGLERHDQLAMRRQGRAGQEAQVLPGVYQLAWAAAERLGPGPRPAKVNVAPGGVTRLWVGGLGRLAVQALGPQGEILPWLMSVANLETGKVEASEKRTPYEMDLPSGYYRVKITNPPLAWTVEVGAGQEVKLATGPHGRLTARLAGPLGPVRAVYSLEDLLGMRPAGTGYTNQALQLLPGRYRLTVQVVPPLVREVQIGPGRQETLDLPLVGAVLLRRPASGAVLPFDLLDAQGLVAATGVSDRPIFTQPGAYRLRLQAPLPTLEAEVKAGQMTSLEPPLPKQ